MSRSWTNEAGEPIVSPEGVRYEMLHDQDSARDQFDADLLEGRFDHYDAYAEEVAEYMEDYLGADFEAHWNAKLLRSLADRGVPVDLAARAMIEEAEL